MDFVSTETRSNMMRRVRQKNTKPEILVRSFLHNRGYRFRLHRKDLPGKPDIVLPKHRTVIFVNGCFWHGHTCRKGKRPTTNTNFWNEKLDRNISRDSANYSKLKKLGWQVVVVWECETAELDKHIALQNFFNN